MEDKPLPTPAAAGVPDPSIKGTATATTVAAKMWEAVRLLVSVGEQLRALEKEDTRTQGQILELTRHVTDLSGMVSDMIGQMKGIEKRLEDKDRMIDMLVKDRVRDELDKLRGELNPPNR